MAQKEALGDPFFLSLHGEDHAQDKILFWMAKLSWISVIYTKENIVWNIIHYQIEELKLNSARIQTILKDTVSMLSLNITVLRLNEVGESRYFIFVSCD